MGLGTAYKHARLDAAYDAVVIGSGIGGLAAASMLARHAGERVLVLERHHAPGGFTHSFRRPGFDWDVGLHYVGEVGSEDAPLRRIFDHLSDGALHWSDLGEVYDRVVLGDETFDFVRGERALGDALAARFPREHAGIETYLRTVRRASQAARDHFAGRARPASRMHAARAAALPGDLGRTTADVVDACVSEPRLRAILTAQWGDYGLPPRQSSFLAHALLVSHYLDGAGYPVGGAAQLARTLIPSIRRAGGDVVVRAEVARIQVENGRAVGVELVDGRRLSARRVISDAGATSTFGALLPEGISVPGFDPREAASLTPSIAHLALYVGLDRPASELALPRFNTWLYPGLDHEATFASLRADPDSATDGAFVSFGSARDPDFERRHGAHATATLLAITREPWHAIDPGHGWRRRTADYERRKADLAERLLALLHRTFPTTRGRVVHAELSTPLTTHHFTGHPTGASYGLAHTPARFAAPWLRPETPIPGLFLTGADACLGGVVGATLGGLLCASAILQRNLVRLAERGRT